MLRVAEQTRYLVLELSPAAPGTSPSSVQIAPPRLGAVLNVGRAHAGEFGGLAEVAQAKGELVEALPADGVALLNADDPLVRRWRADGGPGGDVRRARRRPRCARRT